MVTDPFAVASSALSNAAAMDIIGIGSRCSLPKATNLEIPRVGDVRKLHEPRLLELRVLTSF